MIFWYGAGFFLLRVYWRDRSRFAIAYSLVMILFSTMTAFAFIDYLLLLVGMDDSWFVRIYPAGVLVGNLAVPVAMCIGIYYHGLNLTPRSRILKKIWTFFFIVFVATYPLFAFTLLIVPSSLLLVRVGGVLAHDYGYPLYLYPLAGTLVSFWLSGIMIWVGYKCYESPEGIKMFSLGIGTLIFLITQLFAVPLKEYHAEFTVLNAISSLAPVWGYKKSRKIRKNTLH